MKTKSINANVLKAILVTAAVIWAGAPRVNAAVIYEDNFNRNGDLSGSAPTTTTGGNLWIGTAAKWSTNGSAATPSEAGWVNLLAFTPTSGKIYTLQATLTPPASAGAQWYALGFRSSAITDNWFKGDEPGTALYTGDGIGNYLLGPGADNNTTTSFTSGSSQTFSIILDTTPVLSTAWTLEFKVGGVTQRAATAFGYTPSINYVGFASSIAGGSTDNFSLSVVPEPSTLAMCALMGFGCLARYGVRRRKLNKTILKTV